ncbi:AI-2E family transporter [Alkalibacter mobilis]|uniref:AI-2E family transporter n=1 Tax=Alkalibacter mobilis TaxID=2787712 RepID=UPI00189C6903|nr:AI-2E family transporter [Alkalibacter mobilis]MBF7096206.1 AI-2E family transporter [Alkalibacter mobilis]
MDKVKFKQMILIITYGIVLFISLTNFSTIIGILDKVHKIALPVIYGFVLAYLLNIPYKGFRKRVFYGIENKGVTGKKAASALSIISTYLLAILTGAILIRYILPQLIDSIGQLIENVPIYVTTVETWVLKLDEAIGLQEMIDWYDSDFLRNLPDRINGLISKWLPYVGNYLLGLTSGLYNWIIGLIISVYFLYGKDVLMGQMSRFSEALCPDRHYSRFMEITNRANGIFNKFITGNVIDSLIIGIICFLGMTIMDMPYVLLISLIIGVTNLIPIFGPFIGAVPGIFLILIVDPIKALTFLIFIIALQQFDGNILKPKILGNTVGLPGMWVLISIIVGAGMFGLPGMLLGVPTFALGYSLVREWVDQRLKSKKSTNRLSENESSTL